MLQALIFDVNGTLADTEMGHLAAFNHTFADMGLDWRHGTSVCAASLGVRPTKSLDRCEKSISRHCQIKV
jgi:beta-phosphoglucomutase-like phosphatase (HAD superfamily)